jgi:glycosyltransferase involved in cell wall biosynthesis
VENGVAVERLRATHAKRNYVMGLGRICWEKGFHLGLEAARKAGEPMLLAGAVFPYPAHQEYFNNLIRPRLNLQQRFVGPIGFQRKRRLLSGARALLVTSMVPETSSMVAMEALACGTPVIAFRIGALPEIIEDGRTGFLVDSVDEMAGAIRAIQAIDPNDCRRAAETRFSARQMTGRYLDLYEQLALHQGKQQEAQPLPHWRVA